MVTRPRQSVLKKIAARRGRTQRWDGRPIWAALLVGRQAGAAPRPYPALSPRHRILTPRELEVLRLVATGETDRGIADVLYVSRRTVSSHVSNILDKLDVPSRRAAVVTAARIGLL
jgi:two-component system, NarL family, response regulator DegU